MELLKFSTDIETFKQLRQRAKELEVRYPKPYYKMNKAELIDAINLMVECLNEDTINKQELK